MEVNAEVEVVGGMVEVGGKDVGWWRLEGRTLNGVWEAMGYLAISMTWVCVKMAVRFYADWKVSSIFAIL
jgi:hypothetical protein